MNRKSTVFVLTFLGLALAPAFAESDSTEISRPSFTVFHEFGNIESATEAVFKVKDYWVQRSAAFMNFTAKKNGRLSLDLLIGGIYWNPTYNSNNSSENVLRYFAASAPRLDLGYVFGDPQTPFLKVNAGIFQYKYNEYARNLGEYMFRTNAYPGLVYTGGLTYVDVNRASLTGVKITHSFGQSLSHDLLLNMETDNLPHYDLSLSYMARINLKNVFKVSVGVEFARLLPLRPSVTNPDEFRNRYFTFNDTTYVDNPDYYTQRIIGGATGPDSMLFERAKAINDSLYAYQMRDIAGIPTKSFTQALDSLEIVSGVTRPSSYGYFKASSITPAVSFSFDPKPLLGLDVFGPKDGVIYGEVALLGLKDYPVFYESKKERTIMMVGFNVPAFKFLDVLSLEVEHFGSRFPNSSDYYQLQAGKPIGKTTVTPFPQPTYYDLFLPSGYSPGEWDKDDIKWSVLAQRSLLKGLSLTTQLASDHSRGWIFPQGRRYGSLYRKPSDWYWMFKLTANI